MRFIKAGMVYKYHGTNTYHSMDCIYKNIKLTFFGKVHVIDS